jgi:hypothetical protein
MVKQIGVRPWSEAKPPEAVRQGFFGPRVCPGQADMAWPEEELESRHRDAPEATAGSDDRSPS